MIKPLTILPLLACTLASSRMSPDYQHFMTIVENHCFGASPLRHRCNQCQVLDSRRLYEKMKTAKQSSCSQFDFDDLATNFFKISETHEFYQLSTLHQELKLYCIPIMLKIHRRSKRSIHFGNVLDGVSRVEKCLSRRLKNDPQML